MTHLTLTPADDASLHWRQPTVFGGLHVMASERGEFASLDWSAGLRYSARAACASGEWEFVVKGAWKPRIEARLIDSDTTLATLEITNAWLGNRAELMMGESITAVWESTSFLSGSAHWVTVDKEPLIIFRSGTDEGGAVNWLKTQCRVDLRQAGYEHPHRDFLLCIGWFLTVLQANPSI